jgi:uridine kinase
MKKHYKTHVKIDRSKMKQHAPEDVIAIALKVKFNDMPRPVLVAVGGPGGIGKTTFAERLAKKLATAVVLTLDDYKKSRRQRRQKKIYGPHPEANDMKLILEHLKRLRHGEEIDKPIYCRQKGESHLSERFLPAKFIIVEGEISTYKEFYQLMDFSLFIDSHWKTQLNTRIKRDIEERGYTPEKAIASFLYSNLREFAEYGKESRNWADVHIHCDEDYQLVIDAVCSKSLSFMVDEVSYDLARLLIS